MTPEKRYALDLQEQDRLRNNKPIEETIQRNSERVMRDTNNNLSSLHNPFNNPFNSQLAKDTNKLLTDILKENPESLNNNDILYNTLSYPLKEAREKFETNYLINQLKKNNGNISKTADFIGMERSALHRKLRSLGIKGLN